MYVKTPAVFSNYYFFVNIAASFLDKMYLKHCRR